MSQKQKIKSVEIQKTDTPFKKRSTLLQINPLLTEAIVVGFISSELFQLTLFIMRYHRCILKYRLLNVVILQCQTWIVQNLDLLN